MLRMLGKMPQGGADRGPRGVDSRDEHQIAHAEDVVIRDLLAFHLGLREFTDEVALTGVLPAIG